MPSLLVMVGAGKLDDTLSAQWIEQLEAMRQDALPVIAASPHPTPSVLLDLEKRPDMRAVLQTLRATEEHTRAYLATWCALIASDLSIADTFLLVTMLQPLECRLILRFQILAHAAVLTAIDQARALTLCSSSPDEAVVLRLDVPDLGEQLAQVRVYQAQQAGQNGENEVHLHGS